MIKRCINLDWLELFCSEDNAIVIHDANYYRNVGYEVREREYGTPQYREMFTIYEQGKPFIEIRRNPYSLKAEGGIFKPNDCHVRLSNRACYAPSPIESVRKFLIANKYTLNSISRIDLALDFNRFDNNEDPQKLINDYMTCRVLKINQARLHAHGQQWQDEKQDASMTAHGKDTFYHRVWNSLKWGSTTSAITTKLYNKSLELKEQKDKFYIHDAWKEAGLQDTPETPVWRCEISIAGVIKNYVKVTDGEIIPLHLSDFDNQGKMLFHFHVFANRYFHFKKAVKTRTGTIQRKDRCPDIVLFRYGNGETAYTPVRLTLSSEPTRTDKILANRLAQIIEDETITNEKYKESALVLMRYFLNEKRMMNLAKYEDYMLLIHE